MKFHADYTCERIGTPQIDISFVDEISGEKYNAALSNVEITDWPLPEVGSEKRWGAVLSLMFTATCQKHSVDCLN